MRLFPLNKALLWKEWKQNRLLFWVGLVVLNFSPVIIALVKWVAGTLDPLEHDAHPLNWLGMYLSAPNNIPIFTFGIFAAPVLGSVLLGQERGFANPLEFLAAAPVGRREIVANKYATGLYMIWIVLAVNLLAVFLFASPFTNASGWYLLFPEYLQRGLVLTAIYSLCFCLSTLLGNLFASLTGAFVVMAGPPLLISFLNSFLGPLEIDPWAERIHRLYLPYYAVNVTSSSLLVTVVMALLCVVFYLLAVTLFEHNPFEKNGRVLMFGDIWKWLTWVVPLFFALMAAQQSYERISSIILFVITFALFYGAFRLVRRIRRSLGMR